MNIKKYILRSAVLLTAAGAVLLTGYAAAGHRVSQETLKTAAAGQILPVEMQTETREEWQTELQTDQQTVFQAAPQADQQTEFQADQQVQWVSGETIVRQPDQQTEYPARRQTDQQTEYPARRQSDQQTQWLPGEERMQQAPGITAASGTDEGSQGSFGEVISLMANGNIETETQSMNTLFGVVSRFLDDARETVKEKQLSLAERLKGIHGAGGQQREEDAEESLDEQAEQQINEILSQMSVEDKVAQLFVLLPEQLTGYSLVTAAGEATREAINRYPVGGLIYLAGNLQSEDQIREMIANTQAYSVDRVGLPMFICVDEEGGTVLRISGRGIVDVPYIESMADVGAQGDVTRAEQIGTTMGSYLSGLGFNVDFAPVADVLSNPSNEVVRYRSFGSDPELVTSMVLAVMNGLQSQGVCATLKHFPGHGATESDTHVGEAFVWKTLDELRGCELAPFQAGIDEGVAMIMIGHISLPEVTGSDVPATVSPEIITGLLREEMGYDGIVITDAMNMGAVASYYSSGEAAVKTFLAGTDLILAPVDFVSAYEAVLDSVYNGTITRERLDESLKRILRVKLTLMPEEEATA